MPRISEFYGIIIEMYWSDHHPPHFHAKYGEHRAEIDIRTLGVLCGRLPPKALSLTVEWASLHQQELADDGTEHATTNLWSESIGFRSKRRKPARDQSDRFCSRRGGPSD